MSNPTSLIRRDADPSITATTGAPLAKNEDITINGPAPLTKTDAPPVFRLHMDIPSGTAMEVPTDSDFAVPYRSYTSAAPLHPTLRQTRVALDSGRYDVPVIENIHTKAYEAAYTHPHGFDMKDWAHCRAGCVINLAGEKGANLEAQTCTGLAAALIYLASDPTLTEIPSFGGSDEDALRDMRRLAEKEQGKALPATIEVKKPVKKEEEETLSLVL
jgi:hypothetical protein